MQIQGATSTEIQFHYDVGHEFYKCWLDETMTYSCAMFEADDRFDAIVSIGAFEHFARPALSGREKAEIYRGFFETVRRVMKPGTHFSLQTIAFDRMVEAEFRSFITEQIFPGSMLPRVDEILQGSDRVLSLVSCRNDASDYARTCRDWLRNMQAARPTVIATVGADRADAYVKYLRMSAAGFEQGAFALLRMTFRSHPDRDQ